MLDLEVPDDLWAASTLPEGVPERWLVPDGATIHAGDPVSYPDGDVRHKVLTLAQGCPAIAVAETAAIEPGMLLTRNCWVRSTTEDLTMLNGIRVLIVEDEALVAATLPDAVENAGGEVVGVARTVGEARQLIRLLTFDVAVLDLHLADGDVTPVLEALQARRAPTIVYSGDELPERVRARHPELVALRKPVLSGRIVAEILRARRRGL